MSKNNWTEEHANKVKELFHNGWKVSKIAVELHRSASNVAKKCRELGLKSKMGIMMAEQKDARMRGAAICRVCTKEKSTSTFSTRGTGSKYIRSVCNECDANRALERYRNKKLYSLEETIHLRVYQAKRRAMKKKLEFSLTDADVLKLYSKQGGKCHYSGIVMEHVPKIDNYYTVSIDRVDSKKGYTTDNIVLCCDSINTMKNAMTKETFLDICGKIMLYQKR